MVSLPPSVAARVRGVLRRRRAVEAGSADAERQVIEAIMGMYQAFQQADLPKVGKILHVRPTRTVLRTRRRA
jgi:hypothetical protein